MVNTRKVISVLFAFGLIGRSCGFYNQTDGTVTYLPIIEQLGENSSLTVTFDLVNEKFLSLFNKSDLPVERRAIGVSVASIVAGDGALVPAGEAGIRTYMFIAGIIKAKSNINSCTLTYGTDDDGQRSEGYAYRATTSGRNCDTTAKLGEIVNAVTKCANTLNWNGAARGCCQFHHGGTWTGHLQLTADPAKWPATTVDC